MNQKGRMKMHFSADMTVESILEGSPDALALFKANGLGKFEDDETRRTLGSILKLRTALSMVRADEKGFLAALNGSGSEAAGLDFALDYSSQRSLSMLGLLPCGMKMPFKRRRPLRDAEVIRPLSRRDEKSAARHGGARAPLRRIWTWILIGRIIPLFLT